MFYKSKMPVNQIVIYNNRIILDMIIFFGVENFVHSQIVCKFVTNFNRNNQSGLPKRLFIELVKLQKP